MGYYVNNGNYVYGINEYDQPTIPQYSSMRHKKYPIREFPNNAIRDDGYPYVNATGISSACNSCIRSKTCTGNRIDRNKLLANIINIESSINKVLTITLYGVTEDLDKTVNMKVGNKYCISYITENGLQTVTGVFKELSSNMPDECTKYIGNFSTATTAAYICLDCSTAGESDKRLIYIASIRFIEEVFDEGDDKYTDYTQDEKLNLALQTLDTLTETITAYIESITEKEESEEESESVPEDKPLSPPPHIPPHNGPLIIGARPPFGPPPTYRPYVPVPRPPQSSNKEEEEETTTFNPEEVLESLVSIKDMIDSYIANSALSSRMDLMNGSCCDLGVPLVDTVPGDALERDLYMIEVDNKEEE